MTIALINALNDMNMCSPKYMNTYRWESFNCDRAKVSHHSSPNSTHAATMSGTSRKVRRLVHQRDQIENSCREQEVHCLLFAQNQLRK